jgi:hypothetical protein
MAQQQLLRPTPRKKRKSKRHPGPPVATVNNLSLHLERRHQNHFHILEHTKVQARIPPPLSFVFGACVFDKLLYHDACKCTLAVKKCLSVNICLKQLSLLMNSNSFRNVHVIATRNSLNRLQEELCYTL